MSCPSEAMSEAEVRHGLTQLPNWELRDNALERVYTGKSYLQALSKLNEVAQLSEAADHHPDLVLSWKKLTIRYWTHTAKGITELDFKLAGQVEALLENSESSI